MPCRGYFAAKLMWRVLSLQTVLGRNLPWRFTSSVFPQSGLPKSHSAPFPDAEKYPAAGHRRKAESRERTKSVKYEDYELQQIASIGSKHGSHRNSLPSAEREKDGDSSRARIPLPVFRLRGYQRGTGLGNKQPHARQDETGFKPSYAHTANRSTRR